MPRELRYRSVADELRRRVTVGTWPPGQLLPAESELAADFAVSRVTVRKALGLLKEAGILDSRQGFGWFAARPPLRQTLADLTSVDDQIRAAGRTPGRRVLGFGFRAASPRMAELLRADSVLEVVRLNSVDDEPFARMTVSVPEDLAAELSRGAVEQHPIYELLPVPLGGATQTISALGASVDDASLLRVPVGSPLLRSERLTVDDGGRPVLYSDAVYNPLTTELVVALPAVADRDALRLRLVGGA